MTIKPSNPKFNQRLSIADTDLYEYFAVRTGASKSQTKLVMQVLGEFVLLKLLKSNTARLPGLGIVSRIKKDNGNRVTFKLSRPLADKLRETIPMSFHDAVNRIKNKLSPPTKVSDAACERLIEELRTHLSPKESGKLRVNTKDNYLRLEFLRYLQRDFPRHLDWKHPVNKQQYAWDVVKDFVFGSKEIYPKGYSALYLMWLSIHKRQEMMSLYGLTEKTIWAHLYKVIDLILGQLILNEFPDLAKPLLKQDKE